MLLTKVEYTNDNPMKQQIKFPIRTQENSVSIITNSATTEQPKCRLTVHKQIVDTQILFYSDNRILNSSEEEPTIYIYAMI